MINEINKEEIYQLAFVDKCWIGPQNKKKLEKLRKYLYIQTKHFMPETGEYDPIALKELSNISFDDCYRNIHASMSLYYYKNSYKPAIARPIYNGSFIKDGKEYGIIEIALRSEINDHGKSSFDVATLVTLKKNALNSNIDLSPLGEEEPNKEIIHKYKINITPKAKNNANSESDPASVSESEWTGISGSEEDINEHTEFGSDANLHHHSE